MATAPPPPGSRAALRWFWGFHSPLRQPPVRRLRFQHPARSRLAARAGTSPLSRFCLHPAARLFPGHQVGLLDLWRAMERNAVGYRVVYRRDISLDLRLAASVAGQPAGRLPDRVERRDL